LEAFSLTIDQPGDTIEQDQVLIRYGEISLKSPGVRRNLENMLVRHIKFMLKRQGVPFEKVWRERGRLFVGTPESTAATEVVSRVFGVVSASPVWTVIDPTIEAIKSAVQQLAPSLLQPGISFAVRARRTKTHSFTSLDLARQIGAVIIAAAEELGHDIRVDLEQPDLEVHVEVRFKQAHIFTSIMKGPAGFPYGSQGTVIGLHSGGIDSPVAQWLMMKRGCNVIPLFLDTDQPGKPTLRRRALKTAQALAEWKPLSEPYLLAVPYREVLEKFMRTRRMLYRIATKLAKREKAVALVTGENLGQVASQTLANLVVLEKATMLPVFRPIIGFDKTETMQLARRIGTYQESAKDVGSCFAVPPTPTTQGRPADLEEAESVLDIEQLVETCLDQLERIPLTSGN
jgi:thiamine biosynthesis protein ThiI